MKKFIYKKESHLCKLKALVAGGCEAEAERGIYQCYCGVRWENMIEIKTTESIAMPGEIQ